MIDKSRPVLVADDDEYFRIALAALLTGPLGFTSVIEAGSLDEALERLSERAGQISLALFDLSMPGMDGPATLGAVREYYPDVLIAVVSASQKRRDILVALEAGVHGYVPKVLGPNALLRALRIILGGDIFVPASLARPDVDQVDRQTSLSTAGEGLSGHSLAPDPERTKSVHAISPRQREVLSLLVRGLSNRQIANELSLGEGTVKIHVAALFRNLGVSNRAAAAAAGVALLRV